MVRRPVQRRETPKPATLGSEELLGYGLRQERPFHTTVIASTQKTGRLPHVVVCRARCAARPDVALLTWREYPVMDAWNREEVGRAPYCAHDALHEFYGFLRWLLAPAAVALVPRANETGTPSTKGERSVAPSGHPFT